MKENFRFVSCRWGKIMEGGREGRLAEIDDALCIYCPYMCVWVSECLHHDDAIISKIIWKQIKIKEMRETVRREREIGWELGEKKPLQKKQIINPHQKREREGREEKQMRCHLRRPCAASPSICYSILFLFFMYMYDIILINLMIVLLISSELLSHLFFAP